MRPFGGLRLKDGSGALQEAPFSFQILAAALRDARASNSVQPSPAAGARLRVSHAGPRTRCRHQVLAGQSCEPKRREVSRPHPCILLTQSKNGLSAIEAWSCSSASGMGLPLVQGWTTYLLRRQPEGASPSAPGRSRSPRTEEAGGPATESTGILGKLPDGPGPRFRGVVEGVFESGPGAARRPLFGNWRMVKAAARPPPSTPRNSRFSDGNRRSPTPRALMKQLPS